MTYLDEMIQIIEKELLSGHTESISTGYRRYTEGYLDGLKAAKRYLTVPSDKEIEEMAQYFDEGSEVWANLREQTLEAVNAHIPQIEEMLDA